MNPLSRLDIPLTGLVGDVLRLGLAWIAKDVDREEDLRAETVGDILSNALTRLSDKIEGGFSSKLSRNDRESIERTFTSWYGTLNATRYLELFEEAIKEAVKLLQRDKIDPQSALFEIKEEKNKLILGREYNDYYAILPAILKQPEYYECHTEYLKPTAGRKASIKLDPLWMSIMGLGFLTSFAGYRGGSYYLITKPGVEALYDNPRKMEDLLDDLEAFTTAVQESHATMESEEIYELKLSIWLAKEGRMIKEEHYPFQLHLISLMGQVYTATKTVEIDLRELQDYMMNYVRRVSGLKEKGYNITIDTKTQTGIYPLEALIDLAGRELDPRNRLSGDNEMLTYIMVKDIYRAICSGNRKLMEETLFRTFRHARGLIAGDTKVDGWYKAVMAKFIWDKHLEALQI
ncbi:MAG: type I-A CRISPR-associated protein Cas8a2/Csx9 [Thermoplasmata archaeon]|nr:MAG: type I-A CRISPR-associated protein Cas8a2/Csx9 [Thermoplasmata archaeon]